MYEFLHTIAPKMASSNRNGMGYAAMTEHGLYGERWVRPEDAFKYRKVWEEKDQEIKDMFQGTLEGNPRYNYFLENKETYGAPPFAVIMHARMATIGEPALRNTHPFINNGTALIHNGGISNHEEKHLKKFTSECDSETILNSYIENEVNIKPDNILNVSKDIMGGYACGVLTHDELGIPVLDIFRNHPMLWAMHVKELDAMVFCTSSQDVIDTVKELKWKIGSIFKMKDDTMLRLDARTGKFLSNHSFWGSNQNRYGRSGWSGRHNHETTNVGMDVSTRTNTEEVTTPNLTVLGAAESPIGDTTRVQEILELERAKSAGQTTEKKSVTQEKKSPKILELERAKLLNISTTGPDMVDTIKTNTLH